MGNDIKAGLVSSRIFTINIILTDLCYIFIFMNPNPWTSYTEYISRYHFRELLPEIIGFFLYSSFILVIGSVIKINSQEDRLFSKLIQFFANLSAAIILVLYFIQIAIVNPLLNMHGNQAYELWMFGNPNSLAWGLNYLGWFFGGLSLLGLGALIEDKACKALCFTYSILYTIAFIGYSLRVEPLSMLLGLAWFVTMPVLFVRLTILFRRLSKGVITKI